jgi:hypothetical protein
MLSKSGLWIFLIAAISLGIAPEVSAQSVSTPSFSTGVAESGIVGNNFIVLLPLVNSGKGEAARVVVTSATLGSMGLAAPVLPLPLGIVEGGESNQLVLQFDASHLVLGRNYILTVRGTYKNGTITLGFAVNRFLSPVIPSADVQGVLNHWVVLDDTRAEFASLPGIDPAADAQTMLSFLQSRPEFVQSGVHHDSSSIWADFADGESIILVNDRLPSRVSAATNRARFAPQIRAGDGKLNTTRLGVGTSNQLDQSPEAESLANLLPISLNSATDIPASSSFRTLNGIERPSPTDEELVNDISSWLTAGHYEPILGADASVGSLMHVAGDGIFYITTHAGFRGNDTPNHPEYFTIRTSTHSSAASDAQYKKSGDMSLPVPHLVHLMSRKEFDFELGWIDTINYGITYTFIDTYWGKFSANSLVYIDACHSGEPKKAVLDFKKSIFGKMASIYAGWSDEVADGLAADSTRLVFDRLLGANSFCPEDWTQPMLVAECSDGPAEPPVFAQRPFDWSSIQNDEIQLHGLGLDPNSDALLYFTPNPNGSTFGLLAPSISNLMVDELSGKGGQLTINGIFGQDPRPSGGTSVRVGGLDANVESWNPNAIVVDLDSSGPGAAGDVQVKVRGHESNIARLTEWRGKQFNFTITGNGSLQLALNYNLHFRADIRKFREHIHVAPREPIGGSLAARDSTGTYSASGSGPGIGETFNWSGSGTIAYFSKNMPITGIIFFAATAQIVDSTHLKSTVGAASEANAGATCTVIVPHSPPQKSFLPVEGPSNLGGLVPTVPWYFSFELESDNADILPNQSTSSGGAILNSYFCMDEMQTAKYKFKWGLIPATADTAPDPKSAR